MNLSDLNERLVCYGCSGCTKITRIFLYVLSHVEIYYYWEYKLVQSVFLCIYFKTKLMNRSIKVLSIVAGYFFLSLRQFSNSISKKWFVFRGDPILEPIFDFCERSEVLLATSFGTTNNQKEQYLENTAGEVKHPIWAFPNIFLRL